MSMGKADSRALHAPPPAWPKRLAEADPTHVRARLDLFLEAACEGVYDWNVGRGEVWVSPRLVEIFDPADPDITPGVWLDIIHPDDLPGYRGAVVAHFRSGATRLNVEYRIRTRSGEHRWILDRSLAIRAADGRVSQLVGTVQDVSEQKRREAELAHHAMVIEATLEHVTQGITMVDENLKLIAFNRRCAELLDLPEWLLAGQPSMADIFRFQARRGEYGEGDEETWVAKRLAVYRKFEPRQYERTRPDGTVLEVRGRPLANGRGYVTTFTDITRRKRAERKLLALATTDELTGLPNRRQFFDLAEKEVARATRHGQPYSVMFVDVDRFKSINDTHGHGAGDIVLQAVAATVAGRLRAGDIAGRIGGEEFAVLLPNTARRRGVAVAERLRAAIEARAVDNGGLPLRVTVSIGVCGGDPGAPALADALARADRALYRAKLEGRNRVELG